MDNLDNEMDLSNLGHRKNLSEYLGICNDVHVLLGISHRNPKTPRSATKQSLEKHWFKVRHGRSERFRWRLPKVTGKHQICLHWSPSLRMFMLWLAIWPQGFENAAHPASL